MMSTYIYVSLIVTFCVMCILAWEDIDMLFFHKYRRNTAKFGYNFSTWIGPLILFAFLPFVNMLTACLLLFTMFQCWRDK